MPGSQEIDDDENAGEQDDHQQAIGSHPSRATGSEGFQPLKFHAE